MRTRRVLATRCASGLAIVAALFLCASTVDARALRSELDVGVTGVVTQNDLGVAKVLTDADDADPTTTNATGSRSPAAVETPTDAEDQPSPSSKNSDDDDVLSTGITKRLAVAPRSTASSLSRGRITTTETSPGSGHRGSSRWV